MALKIDVNFDGKLTRAFKNDMKNLGNFHKLKNSDFILENKMTELDQNKKYNNQIDKMQCEKFILIKLILTKLIKFFTQLRKLFTHVLQNRCS